MSKELPAEFNPTENPSIPEPTGSESAGDNFRHTLLWENLHGPSGLKSVVSHSGRWSLSPDDPIVDDFIAMERRNLGLSSDEVSKE